ncbi:HIT family protein [[Clostridium] polysaccharolyticum]|uniref:Histidine triad (HIT) family protein n=1 Tax=[Clostridium] polysaccharolyticum TaxID=29364 RepID=A0A1I0D9Z6_9FIRM|nr:HIT family protein [[Clostridium] polysaccharolyticum]SET29029.1 histidine triad (HIT) family protein [[Clostridium] polysaccharolyticum]
MSENCIFCKIIEGDIPSTTLYEDEEFKVIFDIFPASKGHVIILPRYHAANIFELPQEITAKAFVLAKKIATVLKKVLGCDGINILQNNGEAAGQTVFHLHIHVIPRFKDDNMGLTWKQGQASLEVLEEIVTEAKKYL